MVEDREASIREHLEELLIRLRRIIIAVMIASLILSILPAPGGSLLGYEPMAAALPRLIFSHVVPPVIEGFDGKLYRVLPISNDAFESISLLAQAIFILGVLGASPIIAKEIWEYIEPALYEHEKQFAKRYITLFIAAFAFGFFFGIYLVAPFIEQLMLKLYPLYIPEQYKETWNSLSPVPPPGTAAGGKGVGIAVFIIPFGPILVKVIPLAQLVHAGGAGGAAAAAQLDPSKFSMVPLRVSIGEVVSMALELGLAFGLLFELPIVIYLLLSRGILDPDMFSSETMKYIFVGTLLLGAIISPDPSGIGMLIIGLTVYIPLHVAVYLGKKKALERKLVEEAEALAAR